MSNRLQRFRACMSRLDPTADPGDAIAQGWHVPPPTSTFDRFRAQLELRPCTSHLLLGQVGSGKSTQLRWLERSLRGSDVLATYVDVTQYHDPSAMEPGVLMVIAGLALLDASAEGEDQPQGAELDTLEKLFRRWGQGAIDYLDPWEPQYEDPDGDSGVVVPARLKPPKDELEGDVAEIASALAELIVLLCETPPVFLFDGLDRSDQLGQWQDVLGTDVRGLTRAGAGVVLAGPLALLYGAQRPVAELVDRVHRQPIAAPADAEGRAFLGDILKRRVGDLFTDSAREIVGWASGGVLRDLIALARSALEEAYIAGRDAVSPDDIAQAEQIFGRDLMMGLTKDDLTVLQRVRRDGTFIPTDDESFALLLSRRVLEYGFGPHTYTVHPTLAPLLKQLAE